MKTIKNLNFNKKIVILFSLATLLFSPALMAAEMADDITGTWKAEFDTPVGIQNYTYVIKQEGTKLTGKITGIIEGRKIETDMLEGKFEGGVISFVEMMDIMDGKIRATYKGKLTNGVINFTREVGEFGTDTIVAKRAEKEK
ncbi:MAG TPA: hypothetical protein PK719_08310 [Bacteroidales bacterium]|jgi:hypothetical protein|nr:hypothetical protein [Bacteroidales bacterium]OQB64016.1 MAG: hypothetical protein BWX96_00789 [Bacteroidetes bacterium ADurb.Bin145]NMD03629.1 hypothetical protein [Bacteroidales bacterium]HOU02982.1 hypothetical protein [Bacteroidales bacterium]HQG63648.1 hypothetical protein [Bacteroidales bacterium]